MGVLLVVLGSRGVSFLGIPKKPPCSEGWHQAAGGLGLNGGQVVKLRWLVWEREISQRPKNVGYGSTIDCSDVYVYISIYIHNFFFIYLYIYIYRERERMRERTWFHYKPIVKLLDGKSNNNRFSYCKFFWSFWPHVKRTRGHVLDHGQSTGAPM